MSLRSLFSHLDDDGKALAGSRKSWSFPQRALKGDKEDDVRQRDIEIECIEAKVELANMRAKYDTLRTFSTNLKMKTDALLQAQLLILEKSSLVSIESSEQTSQLEHLKTQVQMLERENAQMHLANKEICDGRIRRVGRVDRADFEETYKRKLKEKSSKIRKLQDHISRTEAEREKWKKTAENLMVEVTSLKTEKKEREKILSEFKYNIRRNELPMNGMCHEKDHKFEAERGTATCGVVEGQGGDTSAHGRDRRVGIRLKQRAEAA